MGGCELCDLKRMIETRQHLDVQEVDLGYICYGLYKLDVDTTRSFSVRSKAF